MRSFITSPLLIWYVIALHIMWGIVLIGWPDSVQIVLLLGGFQKLITQIGVQPAGILILVFAVLASIGLTQGARFGYWPTFCMLLPQYALAMFAAFSSAQVIASGKIDFNGRVTPVDWQLLVIGTGPLIISGTLHTLAILARFMERQTIDQITYLRNEILRLNNKLKAHNID